ncbi:hypothetical protein PBRA_004931 [Plasmodiophora brassicae]|uniref:SCP domain-containing protein n=1 Tax=Plasmodiophora brassicae TaxID=37360 RepID=A0A0G4IMD3_PLABS|nr:hypothetical protein PBRA_004931 [Plasmodiophora brassicae]
MGIAWATLGAVTLLMAARLEALIAGVTPQQVLELINSARASVVPTAAKMVKLEWDASMAAAAASYAATQCSGAFSGAGPQCPHCMSWVGKASLPSASTRGILDGITDLLNERTSWTCKQSGSTLMCSCRYQCNDEWSVFLNDGTTAVGCGDQSASACGWSYNIFVCVFNGFSSYTSPYTPSVTNSSCTLGTCPSAHPYCVNGLCTAQRVTTMYTLATQTTALRASTTQRIRSSVSAAPLVPRRTSTLARVSSLTRQTNRPTTGRRTRGNTTRRRPISRTSIVHDWPLTSVKRESAVLPVEPSTSVAKPDLASHPRHTSVPRSTAGKALSTPKTRTSSSKGAGGVLDSASAAGSVIFGDISNTALFAIGSIAVVCTAITVVWIRKRITVQRGVLHNSKALRQDRNPAPVRPGPLTAPVAPHHVPMQADLQTSAAVQDPGRPDARMPKAIRRLLLRGVARDKFNQGAMTMSVSEPDHTVQL